MAVQVQRESDYGLGRRSAAERDDEKYVNRIAILNTALKDVVRELSAIGITYKKIENDYGIKENALKQYLFRRSAQPRYTEFVHKLRLAVMDLAYGNNIKKAGALAIVATYGSNISNAVENELLDQCTRFYRLLFKGPDLSEIEYATSESVPEAQKEKIEFFCYRKGASLISRFSIEKSRYSFFRDARTSATECFFRETANSDRRIVRRGIVKMVDNSIMLFDFGPNRCVTTHLHCSRETRRAYGITTKNVQGEVSVSAEVLVPTNRVANQALGPLDDAAAELEDFNEEYYKICSAI
jgi:hypothetical protein